MKNIFFLLPLLLSFNIVSAQTIAIDIGHHNKDPGAISAYGNTEYSYNKRLAYDVTKSFKNANFKVNLINESGSTITLLQRTNLAKGSDFFISLHHDSVQKEDLTNWTYNNQIYRFNDQVHGFGVFVSAKNPYFEKSLLCARYVSQSLINQGFVPNYYHSIYPKNNRRELFYANEPVYRYDNLAVLRTATMPAILIEAGVIVNRKEAITITQDEVRAKFSHAVTQAISQCIK